MPGGDVYALGLTLYELLALRPAFEAEDRNRLIRQVTGQEPPRLGKAVRSLPRDLETIVSKAIESLSRGGGIRQPPYWQPTCNGSSTMSRSGSAGEPCGTPAPVQAERCRGEPDGDGLCLTRSAPCLGQGDVLAQANPMPIRLIDKSTEPDPSRGVRLGAKPDRVVRIGLEIVEQPGDSRVPTGAIHGGDAAGEVMYRKLG